MVGPTFSISGTDDIVLFSVCGSFICQHELPIVFVEYLSVFLSSLNWEIGLDLQWVPLPDA